jgi:hypothetical protein
VTTIAYKDGVLASDSGVFYGDYLVGETEKIWRVGDILVGAVGSAGFARKFLDWVRSGRGGSGFDIGPDNIPDGGSAFIILYDAVREWDSGCKGGPPLKIAAPFYAWGSGAAVALGAMAAGASAEEAVKIAIQYDVSSAGAVQVLRAGE